MKLLKILLVSITFNLMLQAQSFFVLSDVDSYDPIVVNMSAKTQKYTEDIKKSYAEYV